MCRVMLQEHCVVGSVNDTRDTRSSNKLVATATAHDKGCPIILSHAGEKRTRSERCSLCVTIRRPFAAQVRVK